MCFCVSAIPSMLWETGKQSPVGDGLLRSISYHQGNRAAPFVKLTFPGTIREYVCVCVFMDLTSRQMLILQREKCMEVFQEKTCMFRTPMSEAVTNSEESVFPIIQMLIYIASCVSVLFFHYRPAVQRNCFVCCEQSLKVFQWPVMALLFMVLRWFYLMIHILQGTSVEIHNGTIIVYHMEENTIFFLVFFYSEV